MSMDPPLDQQASDEFDRVDRTRQLSSRLDVEGVTRQKKNAFPQEELSGSLGISEQVVQRRRITDAKSRIASHY